LRHRKVELLALAGVLGQPRPEVGAEEFREGRLAAGIELSDRAVPDTGEQRRELAPAARHQKC
jgi:hypothetical protein